MAALLQHGGCDEEPDSEFVEHMEAEQLVTQGEKKVRELLQQCVLCRLDSCMSR